MRTYALFPLSSGLLVTRAALHGPTGVATIQLVIDTGAVYTVIHPKFLENVDGTPMGTVTVRALERTLHLPRFTVNRFSVFGASFDHYQVLAYAQAAFTPGVDGVLSIGLLRSLAARLDFASGILTIP